MPSAHDYSSLLHDARVNEGFLFPPDPAIDEIELQARWFNGQFGRKFKTVDGSDLEIVQFGEWNRSAGPDFIHASVSIDGGPRQRGAIELDKSANDWENHGHSTNPDYNHVVAHLFFEFPRKAFFTRTADNRNVPQVNLSMSGHCDDLPAFTPLAKPGRCSAPLGDMPRESAIDLLHSAALHRLNAKAERLSRSIDAHGVDHALYFAIAEALGYSRNKLPFLLIAQRVPLKSTNVESIVFGISGFLENANKISMEGNTTAYLRDIWSAWWKERARIIHLILDPSLWQLAGIRPANHPQRRLAALALLASRWHTFRKSVEEMKSSSVLTFLASLTHDYWSHHYTLQSKPSRKPMAMVGDTRITDILSNVLIPYYHLRGIDIENEFIQMPAPQLSRNIETAATRLFKSPAPRNLNLHQTGIQQGLLQIYHDYCMTDTTDCLKCRFPETVAKWGSD